METSISHRAEQFVRRTTLGEVAERAGVEKPLRKAGIVHHGENDDIRAQLGTDDALREFHAAHAGHMDIDQRDVG